MLIILPVTHFLMLDDYSTAGNVITIYNQTVFVSTTEKTLFFTIVHIYISVNNHIRSNHLLVLQRIIVDVF